MSGQRFQDSIALRWEIAFSREVSHQYEYENDNEHVIKFFRFRFRYAYKTDFNWIKTKITARFKRTLIASIGHMNKINKIMFVWNVGKWKSIFVDASEPTEYDVTTLTHVPTKWWGVSYRFRADAKLPYCSPNQSDFSTHAAKAYNCYLTPHCPQTKLLPHSLNAISHSLRKRSEQFQSSYCTHQAMRQLGACPRLNCTRTLWTTPPLLPKG
jgi:hypothetical protein